MGHMRSINRDKHTKVLVSWRLKLLEVERVKVPQCRQVLACWCTILANLRTGKSLTLVMTEVSPLIFKWVLAKSSRDGTRVLCVLRRARRRSSLALQTTLTAHEEYRVWFLLIAHWSLRLNWSILKDREMLLINQSICYLTVYFNLKL
jgi:hypothetical protein